MRLSLRRRFLLLVASSIVAVVSVLLYCLTLVASEQIEQSVQAKVRSAAYVLSQLLHSRGTELTDQTRTLARASVPPTGTSLYYVAKYAREAKSRINADAVMLTDASGKLLGDSSYLRANNTVVIPKKRDYSAHPAVRSARKGKAWRGVVVRGDNLFLAVGMPVKRDGRIIRTLTTFVRLNAELARQLKRALMTDVVFVHNGREIAGTLPYTLKNLDKAATAKEIEAGRRSYFAGYAPLPGTSLSDRMGMLALDEQDAAINPYRNIYGAVFLAATITLAVALLLGMWVGRSFSVAVEQVIDAAKQIRKGDWPHPFKIKGRDEFGHLQKAFNEMAMSLKRSNDRMLSIIDADPLTGLDNHRKFQEQLEEEVTRTAFSEAPLSLMLVDLDKFQEFNQKHGHAEGDAALTRIAKLIKRACPEEAILARYGGEEFAVLLPGTGLEQAETLAEQIRQAVERSFGKKGENTGMTISVGCAQLVDNRQHKGFVLTAELAVTRAKHLGRNRVCRFDAVPGVDADSDPYQLHRFLQDGSFATIQALAAAVDAKDPYTQGHSQRVAEYARDLAQFVDLGEDFVNLVYTAGALHDVGKVGVPDDVLKKPGKLTDEERAAMQAHPVLGELIVRKAPHLADTLPGIRSHHERWDGNGYPDKLAGEDIPLLGRVLAVADVFDAMTSDRPYRKGMHFWEAIWEIERQAGAQFDPKLALAFVAMMRHRCDWSTSNMGSVGRRTSRNSDWAGKERRAKKTA